MSESQEGAGTFRPLRSDPRPTIGRTVIFNESTGDRSIPRAAIVVGVYEDTDDDSVDLFVMNSTAWFTRQRVPYDGQEGPGDTHVPMPGRWHYPVRV